MMNKENINQDESSSIGGEKISTTSDMYQLKLLNSILIEENKKLKQEIEVLKDENGKLQEQNKTLMAEKELLCRDHHTKIPEDVHNLTFIKKDPLELDQGI